MNKKVKVLGGLVLVVLCFALGPNVLAQSAASQQATAKSGRASVDQDVQYQDIQSLWQDIASQKKQLIASNLVLRDTEATKFWPIYDQYQEEYKKIGDVEVALIKEYAQHWGSVTDEQALQYWQRFHDVEQSVLQLRNKYVPIVSQVLPGKKTATFFQMDRRITLLLDLQLASQIPLVQEQGR
jgi:hypothetical protein